MCNPHSIPLLFIGMVVMTMTAVDYDDPNEGTNAKLTYSIEKNVIDEVSTISEINDVKKY